MTIGARVAATGLAAMALMAVLCFDQPAQAALVVEDFTVSGSATKNASNLYGITSSTFAEFNPVFGTLTGISLTFNGSASFAASDPFSIAFFGGVAGASNVADQLFPGTGLAQVSINFAVSASGTDNFTTDLAEFEGSGTQALVFNFGITDGSVSMSGQQGILTYTFTPVGSLPPVAVPEPGGLSLLAAALAGLFLVRRPDLRRRLLPSAS